MDNIEENNKIIAEFMGLSIKEGVCYYTDEDDMFPMGIEVEEPYIPYDESWDWLIPVVNKIEGDCKANFITKCQWNEFNKCSYCQVIVNIEKGKMSKDRSCIYDSKKVYDYVGDMSKNKIEATYKAVVEFIKWYNEKKK